MYGSSFGLSFVPLIFLLFVVGFPVSKVLKQAGYSRWFTLLAFVPLVNIISLWIFAFQTWPVSKRSAGDVF